MKRLAAVAIAVVLAGLLVGAVSRPAGPTPSDTAASSAPFVPTPPPQPPRELVFFGYVRSLARTGASYELRVDPAEFLVGVTAQRAAVEDGVLAEGEAVPNDYFVVDESDRLLTYAVPPDARVTVVTEGLAATRIPVSELAQIVVGENPAGRELFAPANGFWIRVEADTVRSLDQQYTP